MSGRIIIDWAAIVALPVIAVAALVLLGDRIDACLAPGPACVVHEGVPPMLVVIPAAILWVLAAADLARARRNR